MEITGLNGIREHHEFLPYHKLLEQYEPTSIQRVINASRVRQIADSIRQRSNIQGTFSFTLAEVDGSVILVDGQHRLMALREVMEDIPEIRNIQVHVRRIPLSSMDQALRLVIELGNVSPVQPVQTLEERKCLNEFTSWMNSCVNRPKESKQPNYGNYSKYLLENLTRTGFFKMFGSSEKMMEKTKELNRWLYRNAMRISTSNIENIKSLASFICPDINRFTVETFTNFCRTYSFVTFCKQQSRMTILKK